MSNCCSSCETTEKPSKYKCPVNGYEYRTVSIKTIQHHIEKPWNWKAVEQSYYFCDDPDCDVVYFGEDDSVILKTELRTVVGIKEKADQSAICYCFGVSYEDDYNDKSIKNYVTEQTKNQVCDCEIRNPSGKCCLKDFPRS